MRREDREAMRGHGQEPGTPGPDRRTRKEAQRREEPMSEERMRGGPTRSEPERPGSGRHSGRLPLPD